MNTTFNDPLDELINKHRAANGEAVEIPIEPETTEEPKDVTPSVQPAERDKPELDINFGDDDLEAEIAAEDAAREAARREKYEAMKAAQAETAPQLNALPPQPHDAKKQAEEVDFQADKLGLVTGMVNRVVAKYKLFTGSIPDDIRMKVMGELIDLYHNYGETISPEFEDTIINNWIMEDGTPARDYINHGMTIEIEKDPDAAYANKKPDPKTMEPIVPEPAKITINVPKEAGDVTVNIDSEAVQEMTNVKVLDVIVNEISEKDLQVATVIENSQIEDIIKPYDSGINDVPITLPASAYRAVMKSIAWLDFIKLVAPTAGTRTDNELRKWSVIYNHLKNPSIGNFANFEDFLKHTKYQDRELLMWGLLVATADDEENLQFTCSNPKCECKFNVKYKPREIVHVDPELLPKNYDEVHNAPTGPEALRIHNESSNIIKRYKLPDTGIIVDIKEPSAYDFINYKLALIDDLYKRFRPEGDLADLDIEDMSMAEFDFLSANALYIDAMSIIVPNKDPNKKPNEYRYTRWEDIEKILTTSLSTDDSAVLLKIIQQSRTSTSPVKFQIDNINCPRCKHHTDFIPIPDIGNTLLFQVSRRLDNTQINLKEMQQN